MQKSKKILVLLSLVMALALGLVGCSNDESTEAGTEENTEVTSEEDKEDTNQDQEDGQADEDEGEDQVKEGGSYVVAITGEPDNYNPDALVSSGNYMMAQNIFNRIVKINGHDEVVPDLAKSWEFSEDGKTLTFELNEAKWHDGEEFTADDVKWTFDTILEKEGFAAPSLEDIEEINVVDDHTVDFVLKGPNAGILGALAWQGTFIMPEHLYKDTDWLENETNDKPVGTGPFKFVEHVPGDRVVIEKNPDYFAGAPHLDEVIYKVMPDEATIYQAWLADEIDDGASTPQEDHEKLDKDDRFRKVLFDWPNKSYLCFNMEEGPFSDLKVRQAVLYGIDLDEIFKRVYKEVGRQQEYFIPWQYDWAINEDVKSPERDIEKSKKLLEEAGYEADESGIYFETTIDTFPGNDAIIPVLQKQFEEFGIKLDHNSMDDPTYDKKVLEDEDFELTLLGGYIGPDISALSNRLGTGGFMNYGLYSSEKMDELLEAGVREVDQDKRADIYKEIQSLQWEDLPLVYFRDMFAEEFYKTYIHGHPAYEESRDTCSEHEYSQIWLDK